MRRALVSVMALMAWFAFAVPAQAEPMQWPASGGGNGHYYEVLDGYYTWDEARDLAAGREYSGMQGHLATLTSAEENAFAQSLPRPYWGTWVGGYQDTSAADYSEPAGGWRWVTGEPWGFTDWAQGEPSNGFAGTGQSEEYLELVHGLGEDWNDFPLDPRSEWNTAAGLIVEYEAAEQPGLHVGMNRIANLPGGIQLRFDQVTGDGDATATAASGLAAPAGFTYLDGTYYDITTDAAYTGNVFVTLPYDPSFVSAGMEGDLQILHFENGAWVDRTFSRDTTNHRLTARTSSLSPFVIVYPESGPVPVSVTPASSWWSLPLLAIAGLALAAARPQVRQEVAGA